MMFHYLVVSNSYVFYTFENLLLKWDIIATKNHGYSHEKDQANDQIFNIKGYERY